MHVNGNRVTRMEQSGNEMDMGWKALEWKWEWKWIGNANANGMCMELNEGDSV